MDEQIKTWLFDILQSINEIETYFTTTPKKFEIYVKDNKTRRAIERNLEIIGEAVNRITKVDPAFSLTNAQKIIGTRNRIVHGYDSISNEMIWGIVINHLPRLKLEIEKALKE